MIPLLVSTCALSLAGAPLCAAVSRTGRRFNDIAAGAHAAFEDNASFGLRRHALYKRLTSLREIHSTPNWDGYGALSIDLHSYEIARKLLDLYPLDLPVPELSVDPDGEVSLEWSKSSKHVFTVSISPVGRLSFAGLFGEESIQDSELFTGELPTKVIENIQRVGLED